MEMRVSDRNRIVNRQRIDLKENRIKVRGRSQQVKKEIICWLFLCSEMESEVWYEAEVLELDPK